MRILMLGNSLTSANDLPGLVGQACGCEVVAHTRGGAHLAEQLNPKTRLGARTCAALDAGGWSHVVLQETSTGPIRSRAAYLTSVTRLAEAARACGAEPVLYATWPLAEGSRRLAALGLARAEMADALADAFREAALRTQASVAEVGEAFMRHPHPEVLYARDGVHPSREGSLLAASVLAAALRG